VSQSEFLPDKKGSNTHTSPQKAYEALKAPLREAIDRVIEGAKRSDTNPYAEWKLAFVKANRVVIPGTFGPYKAWETSDVRLILKRAPRQSQSPSSPFTEFGRVIDTSEPQQAWSQSQFMPQQHLHQHGGQYQDQNQPHHHHQQHQQHQQHLPPPPQGMMGQGGQPLPPPPMGPPPGQNKGAPPPQVIDPRGGGGGHKKNDHKDKGGKKSKVQSRNSSPSPNPIRKETKTINKKVTEWDAGGLERRDSSDSDDSEDDSSSHKAVHAKSAKRKTSKGKLHTEPMYNPKYEIQRPPIGSHSHKHMSGGNHMRHPSGSPPSLIHKSSLKEIRRSSQPAGKYYVEKRSSGKYAESDASSDQSYVLLNDRGSSVWSDRGSDYTNPSSIDSHGSRHSRKYHRDSYEAQFRVRSRSRPKHRDSISKRSHVRVRSRSLPRRRDSRRESFESNETRDSWDRRNKDRRYREHSKPEPYRGISPDSISSQGSSTRGKQPPVHVHMHLPDPALAVSSQYPQQAPLALPIRGSPSPTRRAEPRRLAYAEDPTYAPWLATVTAPAPMVPSYEDPLYLQQRQQEDAAKLYLETQRRRSQFERRTDSILRAQTERERLEQERDLEDLKYEKVRKQRELDELTRETTRKRSEADALRRRESVRRYDRDRYDSTDKYVPSTLPRDRARRDTTEIYRDTESWRV
jgi:hypothetical protein